MYACLRVPVIAPMNPYLQTYHYPKIYRPRLPISSCRCCLPGNRVPRTTCGNPTIKALTQYSVCYLCKVQYIPSSSSSELAYVVGRHCSGFHAEW